MMQKVKTNDIRRLKILALASTGYPVTKIAQEVGLSVTSISRIIRSQATQEQLASVIEGLNNQLNQRLPVLLEKSLTELDRLLSMPGLDYSSKLKAIELTLKVATKLSELSLKSK